MRKYFLIFLCLIIFSATVTYKPIQAEASFLNEEQISAIIVLLQSFGVKETIVNRVNAILHGKAAPSEGVTVPGAGTEPKSITPTETDSTLIAPESSEVETQQEAVPTTTPVVCESPTSCTESATCNASGFYWYNNVCNNTPKSSTGGRGCTTAVSCTDYTSCVNGGFYWYTNKCNNLPRIVSCSTAVLCSNEASCTASNFYWYDSGCHSDTNINSGASVFGIFKLFPRFFAR